MWTVEPITRKQADFIVTQRHYSRRATMFVKAFALVDGNGLIDGVVVYGRPPFSIEKYGMPGVECPFFELSRLVIQTERKNAASFLVGRSLQMLPRR